MTALDPGSAAPLARDLGSTANRPPSLAVPAALKAPVLGWDNLWPPAGAGLPAITDMANRSYTTSGRAALLAALRQLALPAGSQVLVPTYHCPTMVAPILRAGLTPAFYPIDADGLPSLDGISHAQAAGARAMFVAHYFGLPKSLHKVQSWCRERGMALVEDCAHSYFGLAGDRPVGQWGDYATASLSKFFPVSEGGLLASATHRITPTGLTAPGWRAQLKAAVDVLEVARRHRRLAGLSHLVAPWGWLKAMAGRTPQAGAGAAAENLPQDEAAMMADCDMGRSEQQISAVTWALHASLPRQRIVRRRRENFAALCGLLRRAAGAAPLAAALPDGAAPYVMPLWVDGEARADAVYAQMRAQSLPVFRWDRIWPGTPADPQDHGQRWNRQLLQLLCHQDLSAADVARLARQTQEILGRC